MSHEQDELARRVAVLEDRVLELSALVDQLRGQAGGAPSAPASPPPSTPDPVVPAERTTGGFRLEHWIDRLGIGLLLVGAGLLLKYSYEKGWLVPAVRVGLVGALGLALQLTGWAVRRRSRRLSAILLGGSVAAWYAAAFGAYQLYELLTYAAAFGAMAAVTILAFALAASQRHALLAVIGSLGGFATPLLLYSDAARAGPLGVYVTLVLVGTSAIYWFRRWDSLLLVSAVGAWAVLIGAALAIQGWAGWETVDRAVFHVGILSAGLAMGVVPAVRELAPGELVPERPLSSLVVAFSVAAPLAAANVCGLFVAGERDVTLGTLALLGLGYAAATVVAVRRGPGALRAALLAGLLALVALTGALAVEGPVWPLSLAFGAVGLVAASRGEPAVRGLALVLVVALLGWSALVLAERSLNTPFMDADALHLLSAVGALAAIGRLERDSFARTAAYQLANALWLATLFRELRPVGSGDILITAAWAAYALVLLAVGLWRRARSPQLAGLVAVLAASTKLLLLDLQSTATIWRIGLLMGIGAALLVMSYLVVRRPPASGS